MTVPSDPNNILEESFSFATREVKRDNGKTFLAKLSKKQFEWLTLIVEKRESLKAVLTVLITSLTKKIEEPNQDIRLHKDEFVGGYSGRTYDTKFITPFMKRTFRRLAMAESGWLTRSLEQPHPFNRKFPGKINSTAVKESFLSILGDIEESDASPRQYLTALLILLITNTADTNYLSQIAVGSQDATIKNIMSRLEKHFHAKYHSSGASRLPVIAIYSIYQCLQVEENARYNSKTLLPLRSHTTSDYRSRGIGDIEITDQDGKYFEGVEVKHNIHISAQLVDDAFEKFKATPVKRYYLLTTSDPCVARGEQDQINSVIRRIETVHGCEVIVNGIMPSLRYYLRLLNDPGLFLKRYAENLEESFAATTDVKEEHLRKWKTLREDATIE